tara:strand:- start:23 stop:262 length:240 start_codon:yes stop_codon:yes gene_type:complete
MGKPLFFKGINFMNESPTRIDKIDYYRALPLSHLIKEAEYAETMLKSEKDISTEKLNDSKIIIEELNRRMDEKKPSQLL